MNLLLSSPKQFRLSAKTWQEKLMDFLENLIYRLH